MVAFFWCELLRLVAELPVVFAWSFPTSVLPHQRNRGSSPSRRAGRVNNSTQRNTSIAVLSTASTGFFVLWLQAHKIRYTRPDFPFRRKPRRVGGGRGGLGGYGITVYPLTVEAFVLVIVKQLCNLILRLYSIIRFISFVNVFVFRMMASCYPLPRIKITERMMVSSSSKLARGAWVLSIAQQTRKL